MTALQGYGPAPFSFLQCVLVEETGKKEKGREEKKEKREVKRREKGER